MGIAALDFMFRIEKCFEVKLSLPEVDFILGIDKPRHERVEPTAGEIHDRLCDVLKKQCVDTPSDSWQRVQTCIAEGIGRRGFFGAKLRPGDVHRESRLVKDLGCS